MIGSAGSVDVTVTSGRLEVDAVGDAQVHAVSGRVVLGLVRAGSVDVSTMSGRVSVSVPVGVQPDLRLASRSGRVQSDVLPGTDGRVVDRVVQRLDQGDASLTVAGPTPPSAHGAFAFCDLAGFTAFTAERGDDAAIELVETFGSYVSDALPAGARIVNRIGDGLLVHFARPSAAVAALLALTGRCADVATPDVPLWVRTGVHVGTARVLGDDLIGHDVNVAARIGELAGATEVLVSESARDEQDDAACGSRRSVPSSSRGSTDALRVYRASAVDVSLRSAAVR